MVDFCHYIFCVCGIYCHCLLQISVWCPIAANLLCHQPLISLMLFSLQLGIKTRLQDFLILYRMRNSKSLTHICFSIYVMGPTKINHVTAKNCRCFLSLLYHNLKTTVFTLIQQNDYHYADFSGLSSAIYRNRIPR